MKTIVKALPTHRHGIKFVSQLATLFSTIVLMTVMLNIAEYTFLPVVEDFEVTEVYKESDNVVLYGVMDKVRNCTPLAVSAYVQGIEYPHVRSIGFPSQEHIFSRPTIKQEWGPWVVDAGDAEEITLYVNHSCHPFWNRMTELGTVELNGVIEE